MNVNKIRPGHFVMADGNPCVVLKYNLRQQPRLATKVITKLRNLLTGAIVEKIFTGGEEAPEADITTKQVKYLYNDGSNYFFMDNETFEQFEFSAEKIGEQANFLIENTDVYIMYFENKPINITLPPTITLKVAETEPGVRGDTAGSAMKTAKMETGVNIQVPLFINVGDYIVVNTETYEYRERAKK